MDLPIITQLTDEINTSLSESSTKKALDLILRIKKATDGYTMYDADNNAEHTVKIGTPPTCTCVASILWDYECEHIQAARLYEKILKAIYKVATKNRQTLPEIQKIAMYHRKKSPSRDTLRQLYEAIRKVAFAEEYRIATATHGTEAEKKLAVKKATIPNDPTDTPPPFTRIDIYRPQGYEGYVVEKFRDGWRSFSPPHEITDYPDWTSLDLDKACHWLDSNGWTVRRYSLFFIRAWKGQQLPVYDRAEIRFRRKEINDWREGQQPPPWLPPDIHPHDVKFPHRPQREKKFARPDLKYAF